MLSNLTKGSRKKGIFLSGPAIRVIGTLFSLKKAEKHFDKNKILQ